MIYSEAEIRVGQEYISSSDQRTRKITSVDKESVSFICIDCITISKTSEASKSYSEFQRDLRGKIFVLSKEVKEVEAKTEEKKTKIEKKIEVTTLF